MPLKNDDDDGCLITVTYQPLPPMFELVRDDKVIKTYNSLCELVGERLEKGDIIRMAEDGKS